MISDKEFFEYKSIGIVKLNLPPEIIKLSNKFLDEVTDYVSYYFGSKFAD